MRYKLIEEKNKYSGDTDDCEWKFVIIEAYNYKYLFYDKLFLNYLISTTKQEHFKITTKEIKMNFEINKNLNKIDKYLAFNENRSFKELDVDEIICANRQTLTKSASTRTRSNSSAALVYSDLNSETTSGKFSKIMQRFPTFNKTINHNKKQLNLNEDNQLLDATLMNQSFSNSLIFQNTNIDNSQVKISHTDNNLSGKNIF